MKIAYGLPVLVPLTVVAFGTAPDAAAQDTTQVPQDTIMQDTMMMDTMQMMQDTMMMDTMMMDTMMMDTMNMMADTMMVDDPMMMQDTMDMMADTMMQDTMQMMADTAAPDPFDEPLDEPAGAAAVGSILDVAADEGNFSTFEQAIQTAGLEGTLSGPGPYTVFAPTDEAFDNLPPGMLDELLADPDRLRDVLLYHVVSGEVMADEVMTMNQVTTLAGESLGIRSMAGDVMVENATVTDPDVTAENGVIHAIDTVLLPPEPVTK